MALYNRAPDRRTRWREERSEADSRDYVCRFADLAAQGTDLHGEARFAERAHSVCLGWPVRASTIHTT